MSKRKVEAIVFFAYVCLLLIFIAVFSHKKEVQNNKENEIVIEQNFEDHDKLSFAPDSANVVKFQQKYSMDWDFIDAGYLLKIAEYHGGSVDDRAYTILVTLYKVFNERRSIHDVVLEELYEHDGLYPYEFEEIIPGEMTKEAMRKILYDNFDNCNGSTEYIEFWLEDQDNNE